MAWAAARPGHVSGSLLVAWASSRRAGAVEETATASTNLTSCLAEDMEEEAATGSVSKEDLRFQLSPASAARLFTSCTADLCTS